MTYTTEIDFEYSVSPLRNSSSPLTVKLICTEVRNRKVTRLVDNEITSISYTEKTTVPYSGSIPLLKPNSSVLFNISRTSNEAATIVSRPNKTTTTNSLSFVSEFSQILLGFGVTDCSVILRDIEETIRSSSVRDRGVIEVKMWKTITRVLRLDDAVEIALNKYLNKWLSSAPRIPIPTDQVAASISISSA